ncbi:MAG: MlaE family lipid ABC transporter permease subunit [Candidatus Eisenbacteria sp.]|nr:MlaE family lipid ABC transporter permease subunit [Candidatus Eisenbacteria bacterium]
MPARLVIEGDSAHIEGSLTFPDVRRVLAEFERALAVRTGSTLEVDLSGLTRIDSGGAALLDEVTERGRGRNVRVAYTGACDEVAEIRRIFSSGAGARVAERERAGLLQRCGVWGYHTWAGFLEFLQLTADTFYWSFAGLVSKRGGRKGAFVTQALLIGVDALPVVLTISFLVGAILALQSAAQLRQFGANIFVADLIAVSMAREMGPLMTAIILAGRSGSAIASEIATMTVTEEIDALKTMGINPVRYIVVPKFYAISLCMPLLSILATLVGILGGLIVAFLYLDLTPAVYTREAIEILTAKDIVTGLVKSVAFAGLICTIGAHYGFRVQGGAEGVGRTTTASVVAAIFAVVVADCFFSLIFYF